MERRCRCCREKITGKPVLKYHDMPGMAQNFPDAAHLSEDTGTDMELYQCEHCGLIQILGKPVPYYRDVIRASAVSDEMKEFRLSYFKEFVSRYGLAGKKIVEIGSGKGEFLNMMAQTGAEVYGIEHEKTAVDACIAQGLHVTREFVESAQQELQNAPFDAFFIMNFLEHIPDPNVFLQGISNNLSDNAIGLIEVPNMDFILDNVIYSEFIADHLMYFTEKTLWLLLEKNGFDILECNVVWHNYCLAAVVKKRPALQLSTFYEKQERIAYDINKFICANEQVGLKTAVWGAGHQALAVIALSDIKDKIEFVVDSAEFKQNKYTPGTHVLIVPPEEVQRRGIGAIIVMAASYSDEVVAIIQASYPKVKIAVLREKSLEIMNREKELNRNGKCFTG